MEIANKLSNISDFTKNTFIKYDIPFPQSLWDKHPHIVHNIALFWGYKDFPDYMEKIILNPQTKDKFKREGFLPDVFMEILELNNLHQTRFPQFQKNNFNDPYGN